MFKKRGIAPALSQVLALAIGAVVIFVAADILFGGKLLAQTRDAASSLWQYTIYGQKDFVPYTEEYTPDEQVIDNSMRALVFSIEKTANPANTKPLPNGVFYCDNVTESEIPDMVCCRKGGAVWTKKADCEEMFIQPEQVCVNVRGPRPKETPLCVDCKTADNCKVKGFELPQKIDTGFLGVEEYIKGVGDPKWLAYYEKFPEGEEKSWQFESGTLFMVGLAARTVFSLAPLAGGRILVPFSGAIKAVKDWRINKLLRLTKGAGELEGAARQNQILKIEKQLDILRTTGRLDEGLATLARSATRGLAGVNAEAITDEAAFKVFQEIAKSRSNSNHFTALLYDADGFPIRGSFTGEGENILRNSISEIPTESGFAYRLRTEEIDSLVKSAGNGEIKNAADVARILRGADDIDEVAEGVARGISSYSKLGKIGKTVGFKKMVRVYLKEGSLEKPLRKGVDGLKAFKKTNPAEYERIVGEVDELMKGFVRIDKNGNLVADFNALFGEVEEDVLINMLRVVDDAGRPTALGIHVNEMRDLLNARTWLEGTLYGSIKSVYGQLPAETTGWSITKTFMINQLRGFGCIPGVTAVTKRTAGWDKLCTKFIRDHYLPFLYAMGFVFALEDKDLMKYQGVGKNNLGALNSELFAMPHTYSAPDADDYFIAMVKEDDTKTRFFAASPCKTDYILTRMYCTCDINDGDFVVEFGHEGKKMQTIDPKIGDITPRYMWDSMNDNEKRNFLILKDINEDFMNGFEEIKFLISNDEEHLKEYFDIMFDDPKIYLMVIGDNRAYGTDIRKIESLSKEEYKKFRDEMIDFYLELDDRNVVVYPEFDFNGQIKIPIITPSGGITDSTTLEEMQKMLVNPATTEPMFPFDDSYDEYDYRSIQQRASIYWLNKDREPSDYPWDEVSKPWQERNIDWGKLQRYTGDKVALVKEMLSHKLYHTQFFNDIAKEAAFKYYIVQDPGEDVIKKCNNLEAAKAPPGIGDQNRKIVVPCVLVKPEMSAYANWNDGKNFCYSAKNEVLRYMEYGLDAVGIIGGLALMGFTGGTSAVVTVAAADLGAITTSFILNKCGEWPSHTASLSGC